MYSFLYSKKNIRIKNAINLKLVKDIDLDIHNKKIKTYINAIKGDNDLNINPIKDEKTITINDVDSTLKKNEMMISNYQWN